MSQFLSEVESGITEITREVSSPVSCSKGGYTLKPVQVAQGSCPVKFSKPQRTDISKLLWVTCSAFSSPQIEKYFAYTQLEALVFQFITTLFSQLHRCWEAPVKSSCSHLTSRLNKPHSFGHSSKGTCSSLPLSRGPCWICISLSTSSFFWIGKLSAFCNISDLCPANCPAGALGLSQAEQLAS